MQITQSANDVTVTSPEGPLKVLIPGTNRGLLGDSQGTNTKIDDLMKIFLEAIVLVLHIYSYFYRKKKYSKVPNGDVHGTSVGPSCETSRGPTDGTFSGRQSNMLFKFNSQRD